MLKIIIAITILLLSMLSFAQAQEEILHADILGKDCHGGSSLCSVIEINKTTGNIKVIK